MFVSSGWMRWGSDTPPEEAAPIVTRSASCPETFSDAKQQTSQPQATVQASKEDLPFRLREISNPDKPVLIDINSAAPIPLENDVFVGHLIIKARRPTVPAAFEKFFKDWPRLELEIAVQGKFKRGNKGIQFFQTCRRSLTDSD